MKRSRFRKWAKWAGLLACEVIVTAWILSYVYVAWYISPNCAGGIAHGGLGVMAYSRKPVEYKMNGWHVGPHTTPQRIDNTPPVWWPRVESNPQATLLIIPLWIPFLALAIPTAFLWHRHRRPPHNHCLTCGYNLTALTQPRCPECGTPFDSPNKT